MASWSFPWVWNSFQAIGNNLKDGYHFGDLTLGLAGFSRDTDNLSGQAANLGSDSLNSYLVDREHTEMREDTAYQRAVSDMRAAGLNPYTVGANPASSSSSSAYGDALTTKLQILGYLLDLKNLDAKNRQIANQAVGNVLAMFKIK